MADWGVKKGLSIDMGYGQRTNDLARQNNAMRQAKIYSDNKTALMADDFDYNNAMNAWDNTAVKAFAQGKTKEIGKFIRENPDYESNLEKRVAYKNLVKELKDNKALNEGLQVDGNIKAMQGYMNDPKNAPLVQSEDFAPIKQQYENYLKTGSIDGNTANRKLFTFTPPEELVDTTPLLAKYAQLTGQNGQEKKWLAKGAGSIRQFATDMDKAAAAEGAINDRQLGKYIQKEYNDYVSKLPKEARPLTLKQYTVAKMQPYFKGDEYKNFSYATGDGSGSGSKSAQGIRNYYDEERMRAIQAANQGKRISAPPAAVEGVLTGGKGGDVNTNNSLFEITPGNFIPFKGAIIKSHTTSGSQGDFDPQNGFKASYMAQMSYDQFEKAVGENAIDAPNWLTFGLSEPEAREKFAKSGISFDVDANGNKVVNVPLWVPLEGGNENTAAVWNHSLGAKSEATDSDYTSPQFLVSPDGTKYQDTSTGIIYDTKTNQPIK